MIKKQMEKIHSIREIKFRVWDKRKQEMSQGELSFRYENEHGIMNVYTDGVREIEEFELMQYVGLKDKNGNETFSDDIVSDGINPPFVVDLWNFPLMMRLTKIDFEIIGTVYENPDLIK